MLSFEEVCDLDGGVQGACDAGAQAPAPVQPVHARHWPRVAGDAQRLRQTTIHTRLGREEGRRRKLEGGREGGGCLYLIDNGLVGCTRQNIFVLVLKGEEVSLGSAGEVLSFELAAGGDAGVLVDAELQQLVSSLVDAPLAEALVAPHAVHRRLIRAELHIEHVRILVCSPAKQVFLLGHI